MPKEPTPTWNFAIVIVRKNDKFLIVQEAKHNNEWYFPAGRVEAGETFEIAARRETLEEAGIQVSLDGIVRIEHTPALKFSRMRVVFLAHPADDSPLKSEPDSESLRAEWVSIPELSRYSLRGPEVREIFHFVENGAAAYPLDLIQREGNPYD